MEGEISAIGREIASENGRDEVIVTGIDGGVAEHQKRRDRRVDRSLIPGSQRSGFGEEEREMEKEDEEKTGKTRVLIHDSSESADLDWGKRRRKPWNQRLNE